jgi:ParB family transcriptional regulator, chromosome partitioning protein
LRRERVLARLHTDISDSDALLMALASAIHSKSVSAEHLEAFRERFLKEGRLAPSARDMIEKALTANEELAPEQVEEDVDADELAADVTFRLGQCNQDLAVLADVFRELDPRQKQELLTQLRYSVELVHFLESRQ